MTPLSIRRKIEKCINKGYVNPQANSLDEIVVEVVRMLPEETYPNMFLEQQEGNTPIEQQILKLAQGGKLKTLILAQVINIDQITISSSSSSGSSTPTLSNSNTPTNSPVGSLGSTVEFFDMEK